MKQILIVDDSLVQRRIIIQALRKAGFECPVLEAASGEQAIKVLGVNFRDIALILCDWHMPEMNGLEFIAGVAKVPAVAKIPAVMVTAVGTEEKMRQAYATHPNLKGYLIKPFTAEQLAATLTPLLSSDIAR